MNARPRRTCRLAASLLALALLAPRAQAQNAQAQMAAEDGYDLWLRYRTIPAAQANSYRTGITQLMMEGDSPTLRAARDELTIGLDGLLGRAPSMVSAVSSHGALVVGNAQALRLDTDKTFAADLARAGDEGYVIRSVTRDGRRATVITSNTDVGVLHGTFHFLRLLQTRAPISALRIVNAPRIKLRVLDHWDNLDRTVERGYAGRSLWDWAELPGVVSSRYRDYARANASIGINGTVLTNVNANATVLTAPYLSKVKALAAVLRPYGIRVYLTARFSAPIELGRLSTADPLDPGVRTWWKSKIDEIYDSIPDFGGLVVKANSEGQPGPQDYKRTHADGANMLADALQPHGGVVMWRAFVYSNDVPVDRIRQAYDEFKPLDGAFRENVLVQVKNGPLDFQPREPFHPLFGAMPKTPLMMEFQVTKEYLGQDTHLVYLAPYFKEVLDADTFANGAGSTVARVIDGSLHRSARTGIAGVANIGADRNWTGSVFNQANWFAYGRLAWDPSLTSSAIADDWIRMTLTLDATGVSAIRSMMLKSREAVVNYMTPMGLAHIMATGHHYGPGPWADGGRADWTPSYYHRADTLGIGFDRTAKGSNAVAQYFPSVQKRFSDRATVPEPLLLWFHHVGWTERMRSGRTLWDELALHYQAGVDTVRSMQRTWRAQAGRVDSARYNDVAEMLRIQESEARWWRDATLLYFGDFSQLPLPKGVEAPAHPLSFYRQLRCPPNRDKPRCVALDAKPQ